MTGRQKGITLASAIGGVVLLFILVFGTMWMGSNARNDTESAVRSVSLLYLDELVAAGSRSFRRTCRRRSTSSIPRWI